MNRFDRNERLFGRDGQEKLRRLHVAVPGCGGLGQHVVQQLASLGVGELTLIDDEDLSHSNLNRYPLARHDDPVPGTAKVDIAARTILGIDPDIKINKVPKGLRSAAAFKTLHRADLIIGCFDNDGARLVLTEFALAYRKDYFDLASDISTDSSLRYGGRILFTGADYGCPVCFGEIDPAQARMDLESDASRRDRERIYGINKALLDEGGPSVVSINGVVASLAVTEVMLYVTGLRMPKRLIFYRGNQGIVTVSRDTPAPCCYFCEVVKGIGANANVERYILEDAELKVPN